MIGSGLDIVFWAFGAMGIYVEWEFLAMPTVWSLGLSGHVAIFMNHIRAVRCLC